MKKLMEQIMKFGAVGFLCFFIDYIVGFVVLHIVLAIGMFGANSFSIGSQIGSALGFTVSVIVNYILSFKFVFERKEDMNRKAEFVIFIILSVIGLGLNQVIMWICTVLIYNNVEWIQQLLGYSLAFTAAKVVATAIVMVYNFITRKIFLEKK
ncbi:MAG: GtrA family protein [Lachnospiraceae bacterium]|nr:GtrA family protein [Lachnospiraceae bacterium]